MKAFLVILFLMLLMEVCVFSCAYEKHLRNGGEPINWLKELQK